MHQLRYRFIRSDEARRVRPRLEVGQAIGHGPLLATEQHRVDGDGGLPIGGLGGTREVMSVFELDGMDAKVKHSGTFTANAMSMATGYAGMRLLTPEVFAELDARGERLRKGLNQAITAAGLAAQAIGEGSMSSVVITGKPVQNYRELAALFSPQLLQRLMGMQHALLNEGVLTMRGMFVASTPMTDNDIDFTIEAAARAFKTLVQQEEKEVAHD